MLIIKDLNVDDLISSADIAEASRHFFCPQLNSFFLCLRPAATSLTSSTRDPISVFVTANSSEGITSKYTNLANYLEFSAKKYMQKTAKFALLAELIIGKSLLEIS